MFDLIKVAGRTPVEAWIACLDTVLRNGTPYVDSDETILEVCPLLLSVSEPTARGLDGVPDEIRNRVYAHVDSFLSTNPHPHKGWSYGERILVDGANQLDSAYQILSRKPESKAATAVTIRPGREGSSIPCLVALDWKMRNAGLQTTAYFRSQDVFDKQLANIIEVATLTSQLADRLGMPVGSLIFFISSAHVYRCEIEKIESLLTTFKSKNTPQRCRPPQVLVVGKEKGLSASDLIHKHALWCAEETGRFLARRGIVTLTGGLGGIMEHVSIGVSQYQGVAVGVVPEIPCEEQSFRYINTFQTAVVHSGLRDRERIPLLVNSADAVICISGGAGAKKESVMAMERGLPVAVIKGTGGAADELAEQFAPIWRDKLLVANTPKEAVDWVANKLFSK